MSFDVLATAFVVGVRVFIVTNLPYTNPIYNVKLPHL